jgi:hypothetical protein
MTAIAHASINPVYWARGDVELMPGTGRWLWEFSIMHNVAEAGDIWAGVCLVCEDENGCEFPTKENDFALVKMNWKTGDTWLRALNQNATLAAPMLTRRGSRGDLGQLPQRKGDRMGLLLDTNTGVLEFHCNGVRWGDLVVIGLHRVGVYPFVELSAKGDAVTFYGLCPQH